MMVIAGSEVKVGSLVRISIVGDEALGEVKEIVNPRKAIIRLGAELMDMYLWDAAGVCDVTQMGRSDILLRRAKVEVVK